MRSVEEKVDRLVCAEHCRFYKPWHGDEHCGAHAWILEATRRDPAIRGALERFRGSVAHKPLRFDSLLLRDVCRKCRYYPEQCRYRKASESSPGEPCGGLIALELLLDREYLSEEEFATPRTSRNKAAL